MNRAPLAIACSIVIALLAAARLADVEAAMPARAQPPVPSDAAVPQITASGSAEVRVASTKASFSIGVVTDSSTAAQAGAENARIEAAVERALREAGLSPHEIVASGLTVYPRWAYDEASHRQRRIGFEATHTLEIETPNLARVGVFIDAGLGAGASSVSQIEFAAGDPAAARQQALAKAVQNARGDAQAIARAAGGSLGELLQISTEEPGIVPGMALQPLAMNAARRGPEAVGTSIAPTDVRVTARIVARFRFVPTRQ